MEQTDCDEGELTDVTGEGGGLTSDGMVRGNCVTCTSVRRAGARPDCPDAVTVVPESHRPRNRSAVRRCIAGPQRIILLLSKRGYFSMPG